MEKLSFYDIDRIFEELNDRKSSAFELDMLFNLDIKTLFGLKSCIDSSFHVLLDRLGEFKIVDENDMDCDGYNTEQIFRVYHFIDHDVYMKVRGYRSSYSGDKFESMKEVKPVTKIITVYE